MRFVSTVVRNVLDDQIFFRGTSLAFTSTITLVPIIMVVFSFGGFDRIGTQILEGMGRFLLPESSDEIISAFRSFTENARRVSTLGSLLFLVSAIFMMNATENHLNTIFRIHSHRSLPTRAGLYIVSLGLISLIFGSGYGPISGIMDAWHNVPPIGQRILGIILSILGAVASMTFMFTLLSSTKIHFRSALIGSTVGALAFQAAKYVFTFWMQNSVRQSIIYGSVVFIPKLLLWMATAWSIFLIAAEISYADQIRAGRRKLYQRGTPADETAIGWRLFLAIADDFRLGARPPSLHRLASRLAVDESRIGVHLHRLEDGELIRPLKGRPPGYIPAAALNELKASTVIAVISGWEHIGEDGIDDAPRLLRNAVSDVLGDRSVGSFLPEVEGHDGSAGAAGLGGLRSVKTGKSAVKSSAESIGTDGRSSPAEEVASEASGSSRARDRDRRAGSPPEPDNGGPPEPDNGSPPEPDNGNHPADDSAVPT